MDFGNLAIVASGLIIGVVAIALLLKYTGISEFMSPVIQLFASFVSGIRTLISYAPKPVRVGVFLLFGVAVLGTFVSWVLAANMVCVESDTSPGKFSLYSTDFATATLAKLLPNGPVQVSGVEEGLFTWVSSGRVRVSKYGGFLNDGGSLKMLNTDYKSFRPGYSANARYVLVDSSYNESSDPIIDENSGGILSGNQYFYVAVCKNENTSACYVRNSGTGWTSACDARASLLGIPYRYDMLVEYGVMKVSGFEEVTIDSGDVETTVKLTFGEDVPVPSGGLGQCSEYSGSDGVVISLPVVRSNIDGVALVGDRDPVKLAGYSYAENKRVQGKFLSLDRVVRADSVNQDPSSRGAFMKSMESKGSASVYIPDSSSDLTYECEGDSVEFRVFGVDVLSWQFLLMILVGIGVIQFLRWVF